LRRSKAAGESIFEGFSINCMSEAAIDRVHDATLEVLKFTGIKVYSDEALEIYQGGGCTVDKASRTVFFPAHVVEDCIRSAPSSFVLAARDPKHDYVMGGRRVGFCNFSCGVQVVDLEDGSVRDSTKQDTVNVSKLVDYLDQYDILDCPVVPRDVNQAVFPLHNYEAMISNTSKHCSTAPFSFRLAEIMLDMASTVAGGKENLRRRPIISADVCPQSPLSLAQETCETIISYARHEIPVNVLSMALAGGTSPVTLAGTLVTHNAEVLAGICLSQLTKRGTPNIYGSSTTMMEMRRGTATVGCPEMAMLGACVAAMAKSYQIPSFLAGS
jgi:trimethylamine---corrinoid protein Co-methyltransferase